MNLFGELIAQCCACQRVGDRVDEELRIFQKKSGASRALSRRDLRIEPRVFNPRLAFNEERALKVALEVVLLS
jgi:hypothetical protein